MKIAVVFGGAHRRGGVERVTWELLRYLGQRHDTTFVGGELEAPDQLPGGITHLKIDPATARRPREFRSAAAQILESHVFDARITLGANCPPGDVLMVGSVHRAWLRQGRPIPVGPIHLPPGVRYAMPRHRTLLRMEQQYFAGASDRVVVPCGAGVAADLERLYGITADAMSVIPNGFSGEEFHPGRRCRDRTEVRQRLGLPDDGLCVLFVGNELHRKGFGTLLAAAGLVADPRIQIHVVGKADPAAYHHVISRHGLREQVVWHGPTNDVAQYFAAADVFALPTQYEPFGIVIVEALAMGVPVITTSVAGAAAPVAASGAGMVLSSPDDPHALGEALRQALDPEILQRWARQAPAAAAPFEWQVVMAQIEGLLLDRARR